MAAYMQVLLTLNVRALWREVFLEIEPPLASSDDELFRNDHFTRVAR